MSGRHPWPPPMKRDNRHRRVVVLTVGRYLCLVGFAFLAGMLLAALIIGTHVGKVGV